MSITQSSQTFHHPRLLAFAKRFEQEHVDLVCHAAFPLALTPELLYCLRENFLPRAPWIAVADILLFLCEPVGYQLYELEGEVRNELLIHLKNNFDEKRFEELSDFMVAYIRQQLKTNYRADQDLGAAPQWTALAYIKPEQAVDDIAQALKKALAKENPAEWVQFTSLIESYAYVNPLIESGFQPLLTLARGWDAKARGEEEEAAAEFEKLREEYGEEIEVGGVRFEIPSAEDDELLSFEFEVVTVNRRGEIIKRETKQARYFTEDLGKGITLEMVAIPGGKFMMGSPEGEGDDDEKPQHEVTVQPFFMGKYPVTQAQWRLVAALPQLNRQLNPDPSRFKGDDRPVECVSWFDAVEFCDRLSNKTGKSYRLPSEAEWEYACRAGTTTPFHCGETLTDKLANYNASYTFADEPKGEYREETTPVGTFSPNSFGLYDMHGNVWEWCADNWHKYQGAPIDGNIWHDKNDPKKQEPQKENTGIGSAMGNLWKNIRGQKDKKNFYENDNHFYLLRGGSWDYDLGNCRSAYRNRNYPDYDDTYDGFRVVCGAAARTQ